MRTLNKILELMHTQGKKQKELTDYIGVSKNIFTDWKSGKNSSYKKHIPKIAEFLGVSTDYLLGMENSETNPASDTTKPMDALINQLNEEGIKKAVDYITDLLDNPKYKKQTPINTEPLRALGIDNTLKAVAYEGKGIIDDTLKHT